MPIPVNNAAVIAVYLNAEGYEIQREILTQSVKEARQINADPDYIEPFRIMTIEITCGSNGDLSEFKTAAQAGLGDADAAPVPNRPQYSVQELNSNKLRYVFDTSHPVPLDVFAEIIRTMVQKVPSRCNTLSMFVCGGCVAPCRPKTCNNKASCGWASGCPC